MATILKKLTVDAENLGIFQPILKAEIWNRRSYLVDTFVTIPDFHQKFIDIQNNELLINLLRNTYGSFYEIVLFGAANIELLRCFFIMPDSDSNLSDIRLLTAYPEASTVATSFLMLSDTPDSYFQQGGKVVAVREDEKGLEFIDCHCGEQPDDICAGSTATAVVSYDPNSVYTVTLDDVVIASLTPIYFNIIGELQYPDLAEAFDNKVKAQGLMNDNQIKFTSLIKDVQRIKVQAFIGLDGDSENIANPIFTPISQDNLSLRYLPKDLVLPKYSEVEFCLAHGENYPPYAVFKTTASWGTVLPATITINGAVHTGNLYGELADILAHSYKIYTGLERQDDDCYRIVFAGDIFADNFDIKIELNIGTEISIDDHGFYSNNPTIQLLDLTTATFNLGKLVCQMGVWQHGVIQLGNPIFGENYECRVSDRVLTESVTTTKVAGALNGDPTAYCANTYYPQECVKSMLFSDLAEQWNVELASISAIISDFNQNPVLKPLNTETAKMVIQPTDTLPLTQMHVLGYVIPICGMPM
ncbi:hypothetical protein [Acinetobacter sp. CFCC 10889]|uniref:hypothetical protein n=1 Tax=Acinetobacter sp. CFCC 10889 TaxID=1775557 RepID=UPI000DCFA299|nr:hypothetical protein [Acinetobacter sp. CFCC 10889]